MEKSKGMRINEIPVQYLVRFAEEEWHIKRTSKPEYWASLTGWTAKRKRYAGNGKIMWVLVRPGTESNAE